MLLCTTVRGTYPGPNISSDAIFCVDSSVEIDWVCVTSTDSETDPEVLWPLQVGGMECTSIHILSQLGCPHFMLKQTCSYVLTHIQI